MMYFCGPTKMMRIKILFCFLLISLVSIEAWATENKQYKEGAVVIVDELGLFSQTESQKLLKLWGGVKSEFGLEFACLIYGGELPKVGADSALSFVKNKLNRSLNRTVVFYVSHANREVSIHNTPDLDSLMSDDFIIELKQEALISNFEKGWWEFGVEEASLEILRKYKTKTGSFFDWSASVWVWLVFGFAIVVTYFVAIKKNAITISASSIRYGNILRNSAKIVKEDPDERIFFDGKGESMTW
jgi:uncharacterized membrane protein YgcG